MEIIRKEIDMICYHDKEGNIRPYRFRVQGEDQENHVIHINRIIDRKVERFGRLSNLYYTCESIINGTKKTFEVQFMPDKCQWAIVKIL